MKLPAIIKALNLDTPLKKHTATIHVEANFNATEHKLLNIFYKSVYDSQEWNAEHYYVKLSDIKGFLGRVKMNHSEIKKNLEKLRTAEISWNIFRQDQKNKEQWEELATGATGFISSWLLLDDCMGVRFSLSPEIKRMIQSPNIFAYIDLKVQKKLTSKYEIILYELMLDELSKSRKDSIVTRWYSIGDLMRIFGGTSSTSYLNDFRAFNRYCIKKPIQEVNKHSDLIIEINDAQKVKNKIVAYNFKINKKYIMENPQLELELSLNQASQEDFYSSDATYNVIEELSELFNNINTAKKIYDNVKNKYNYIKSDNFNEELIKENIEYTKKSQKSINNFLGYMMMAIENDYAKYEAKFTREIYEQLEMEDRKHKIEFKAKQVDMEQHEEYKKMIAKAEERRENLSMRLNAIGITELSQIMQQMRQDNDFHILLDDLQMFIDYEQKIYLITPHRFSADFITANYFDAIKKLLADRDIKYSSLNIMEYEAIIKYFF